VISRLTTECKAGYVIIFFKIVNSRIFSFRT